MTLKDTLFENEDRQRKSQIFSSFFIRYRNSHLIKQYENINQEETRLYSPFAFIHETDQKKRINNEE